MREESSLVMGGRGGGLGVGCLRLEPGGGMGMAIDQLGGAEDERSPSGMSGNWTCRTYVFL